MTRFRQKITIFTFSIGKLIEQAQQIGRILISDVIKSREKKLRMTKKRFDARNCVEEKEIFFLERILFEFEWESNLTCVSSYFFFLPND